MSRAQVPPRTRTRSADVTDSLLDAALEILEEDGADAMTVRAVAARAEVAPMGVYSKFGGKTGLIEAIFVRGFTELLASINTASGPNAIERIRTGCQAYRLFAIAHPHLYQLMFKQMLELDLSEEALETAASTFGVLVSRIDDAMNAGLLERRDEVEVAQQFWNGMHGGVLLELAGIAFTADPEQTFADMLDALLRGSAAK